MRCEWRPYPEVRITPYRGRSVLDSMLGADIDTATLAWLVSALDQARGEGQSKAVGYLVAVLDDVVFEIESVARRS